MATSTFERKIEISDPDALEKLVKVMAMDLPEKPLSERPYTSEEREQSDELLRRFLSR